MEATPTVLPLASPAAWKGRILATGFNFLAASRIKLLPLDCVTLVGGAGSLLLVGASTALLLALSLDALIDVGC